MKKLFIAGLAAISAVGLAACKKNEDDKGGNQGSSEGANEVYLECKSAINEISKMEKSYKLQVVTTDKTTVLGTTEETSYVYEGQCNVNGEGNFHITKPSTSLEGDEPIVYDEKIYKFGENYIYKDGEYSRSYFVPDYYAKERFLEIASLEEYADFNSIEEAKNYMYQSVTKEYDITDGITTTINASNTDDDNYVKIIMSHEDLNYEAGFVLSKDYVIKGYVKGEMNTEIFGISCKIEFENETIITEGFDANAFNSADVSSISEPTKKISQYCGVDVVAPYGDFKESLYGTFVEYGESYDDIIDEATDYISNYGTLVEIDKIYTDEECTKEYVPGTITNANNGIDTYVTLKALDNGCIVYYSFISEGTDFVNYSNFEVYNVNNTSVFDAQAKVDSTFVSSYTVTKVLVNGIQNNDSTVELTKGDSLTIEVYVTAN